MVCIYEHRPGPGSSTLGGSGANLENWRTRSVLRGHTNNVVDLSWAPDDARLASASLDNSVRIWDAATGQLLRRLDYHTSFIKGLAWDPVGALRAGLGAWGERMGRLGGRRRLLALVRPPPLALSSRHIAALPPLLFSPSPRHLPGDAERGPLRGHLALRRLERRLRGQGALCQAGHKHLLHPPLLVPRRRLPGHRWAPRWGWMEWVGGIMLEAMAGAAMAALPARPLTLPAPASWLQCVSRPCRQQLPGLLACGRGAAAWAVDRGAGAAAGQRAPG